jgi:multiple sugar transport system substrate-binding protein
MIWNVPGKAARWNDPKETKWGSWTAAPYPLDPSLKGKYEVGPANTEFWCMVIPKNAQNKDLSWSFIKHLASHDSQLAMALNGNGPTRSSVFADAKYVEKVPFASVLEKAQAVARVPLPGFDKSAQAAEMLDNYIERALLGEMTAEAAMKELTKKLKELSSQLK